MGSQLDSACGGSASFSLVLVHKTSSQAIICLSDPVLSQNLKITNSLFVCVCVWLGAAMVIVMTPYVNSPLKGDVSVIT